MGRPRLERKKCIVPDCPKLQYQAPTPPDFKKKAYCSHHAYMKHKYGDPLAVGRPRGAKKGHTTSAETREKISQAGIEAWRFKRRH